MTRLTAVVVVTLVLYLGYTRIYMRPSVVARGQELEASGEPQQAALTSPEVMSVKFHGKSYLVEKLHCYEITGEVLSLETYNVAFKSEFFDVDLGLIWGPRLAELKRKYSFNQGARWLFWSSDDPVPDEERRYITSHISNNHLIPAGGSRNLFKAIRWPSCGDKVRIKGCLVTIKNPSGDVLAASSTSRDDTGAGACEVILVDEIQINTAVYR